MAAQQQDQTVVIVLPQGGFSPGDTEEPTGTSEIEFDISLGEDKRNGGSFGDFVQITTDLSPADENDNFRFGSLSPGIDGANLNAPCTRRGRRRRRPGDDRR